VPKQDEQADLAERQVTGDGGRIPAREVAEEPEEVGCGPGEIVRSRRFSHTRIVHADVN
jgi:hypothetical protein